MISADTNILVRVFLFDVRGDFYYFRLAPIIFAGSERSVKNKKDNKNNLILGRDAMASFCH